MPSLHIWAKTWHRKGIPLHHPASFMMQYFGQRDEKALPSRRLLMESPPALSKLEQFTLSDSSIECFAEELLLPASTVNMLKLGLVSFAPVSVLAAADLKGTALRVKALDQYGQDSNVMQSETVSSLTDLLDPLKIGAKGVIMQVANQDAGYALVYPVYAETRSDLDSYFYETRARSPWSDILALLKANIQGLTNISEADLYHHYDVAIQSPIQPPDLEEIHLRRRGLARLCIRQAYHQLSGMSISVGFIDSSPKRSDSLLSFAKAGGFLSKEVFPSPDGEHASFLTVYSRDLWQKRFSGNVVFAPKEEPLSSLPSKLRMAVGHRSWFVGFNRDSNCLEEVTLTSR